MNNEMIFFSFCEVGILSIYFLFGKIATVITLWTHKENILLVKWTLTIYNLPELILLTKNWQLEI